MCVTTAIVYVIWFFVLWVSVILNNVARIEVSRMCLGDLVWKYDNFFSYVNMDSIKEEFNSAFLTIYLFIDRLFVSLLIQQNPRKRNSWWISMCASEPWCVFVCSRGMFFSILDLILLELYLLRCAEIQRKNKQNDEEQKKNPI